MFPSRRITIYVLRELFTPTLLGLSLYTFVMLMNHFFVIAEKALAKNLGFELTLRLFLMGIPNLLVMTIPMSVLLGTLIAVGRLSADHEWVALQSAGQGPSRLLKPVIIHGLIATLLGFFVYAYLSPRANYVLRNLRGQMLFASNLAADLKPRVFYTSINDMVLFVEDIRAGSKGRLDGVLVVQTDPKTKERQLFLAESGDLYPAPDNSGALILDLYDGQARVFRSEEPETYRIFDFESVRRTFPPAAYLSAFLAPPEKGVQDLTPLELLREFREARSDRAEVADVPVRQRPAGKSKVVLDSRVTRATIELHQRMALPVTSFCFALLALPLGITRVRSGKGAGFALSLLVILVYWSTFTFARDQALSGSFPAALGPWAGNIVIFTWALWALWRMRRPPSRGGPGLRVRLTRILRAVIPRRTRGARSVERKDGELPGAAPLDDLGGTPNRFVTRIDLYIASAFLRMLFFSLLSVYLIYALVESKNLTDDILRYKKPFSLLLDYFKYFAPGVLHIVLPISCLVGAVVAFSLLSRTGELTAIKASGMSVRRATMPVLVLTVFACGVLFAIDDHIAPTSNRRAQVIKDQIGNRAPRTHGLSRGGWWGFGPGGKRLYHCVFYDRDANEIQGLSVFELGESGRRVLDHRYAEHAVWRGTQWQLNDGWYRSFPAVGEAARFESQIDSVMLELDPPANFELEEKTLGTRSGSLPEQMSLRELREQIRFLEERRYDITKLRVAYYGKWAQATTPLIMVLLGLPFAFKVGRRGSLYGIGVALILVLVYWATFALFNALGLETFLEPWVAAWAPNAIFGLLGTYLLLYVRT